MSLVNWVVGEMDWWVLEDGGEIIRDKLWVTSMKNGKMSGGVFAWE